MTDLDADELQQDFDDAVYAWVSQGWRIESERPGQVVLVHGQRVNHLLHLLLTVLTIGLWGLVWIGLAVTGGERRVVIRMDPVTGKITRAEA